jgi:hypothetical protein
MLPPFSIHPWIIIDNSAYDSLFFVNQQTIGDAMRAANGICRTDWHLWTGDWTWRGLAIEPPSVLGHEFSGSVAEILSRLSRVFFSL